MRVLVTGATGFIGSAIVQERFHCDATSACLPRHRAAAYLFLVRQMTRRNYRLFVVCWLSVGLILPVAKAIAPGWPDGYVVYERTESHDGRYSILVPSMEAWEKNEALEETNYFADLKEHRLMGKVRGADYFEHQNHRALKVVWASDSTWCVVEYDDRFGFGSISIVEPKGSTFVQTDIGKRIEKVLRTAIKERSRDSEGGGDDAVPYFRIGTDHKLQVRALLTTDPKQLDLKNCQNALFYGTFDVNSKKWLSAEARALKQEEYDGADSAFADINSQFGPTTFAKEEDRLRALDESMNGVYGVVRAILPAARFAAVKKEQIEWLKKRDVAGSTEEKCKLVQARIKELQQFVW